MDISRLYHTLRHLKAEQWLYRGWYKLKKKLYTSPANINIPVQQAIVFGHKDLYHLHGEECYDSNSNTFTFLDISHKFRGKIDWEFEGYGKLWTYNLNYFNWLSDEGIDIEERLRTVHKYLDSKMHLAGSEPYPISLRGIQWIKFLVRNNIFEKQILETLYKDYHRLAAFPEYHLQANHLLENGFSLFYAAHFFNDKDFYEPAHKILAGQLKEQILPDGGHYELSPMYHCIILQRLLECIELQNLSDRFKNGALHLQMEYTAQSMLGWLKDFVYEDGSYAMMGDAAPGIALSATELFKYAEHLQIKPAARKLKESGYRKYTGSRYELLVDAGNILPAYQPGHAHADTFSFCLNVNGKPIIVDTGISTYEKNKRRLEERGTAAHNTISVDGRNSSDVWDGFRTGRKASVSITEDSKHKLVATHNGYADLGITHERTFEAESSKIVISDRLTGYKGQGAYFHIHFHPSCIVKQAGPTGFTADNIIINIQGGTGATLVNYLYCSGYNKTEPAIRLRIHVEEHAVVSIEL